MFDLFGCCCGARDGHSEPSLVAAITTVAPAEDHAVVHEPAAAAARCPEDGPRNEAWQVPASDQLPWLLVFGSVVLAAWLASEPAGRTMDCVLATMGFLALVPAQLVAQVARRWLRERLAATPCKPTLEKRLPQAEGDEAEAARRLLARLGAEVAREVSEADCRRFLRAWKGDVDGAAGGLQKYLDWRKETRPADITADDVKGELATGKGYPHGFDRSGRPVMWAFAGKHDKSVRDVEETVKLILWSLETAIKSGKERGAEQVCLVFDLSGFGSRSMDYEVVRRLFLLLANYYPERLGQVLLLNAPRVFNIFWRVISPYIDPVTFKKIQFVSKSAFCDFIEPGMLPREMAESLQ